MYIKEYEREGSGQSDPEDDETENEAHEGGNWCQVAERLGTKEARERILFHRAETILLLGMEQIRDLGHHAKLSLRLRFMLATKRETVYPECRGKIDLVVLLRVDGITSR